MPSSSSSTNLNANAAEFVPTFTNSIEVTSANSSSNHSQRNTGAIPKRASGGGRGRNRYYYYQENRRYNSNNNGRNYEKREDVVENDHQHSSNGSKEQQNSKSKKFFRNNNNYSNNHHKLNNRNRQNHNIRFVLEKEISQRDRLIKEIETNSLECMICCEKIKAYAATFNCSSCYHIVHLNCIKTWVKNSKNERNEWRCPACNQVSNQHESKINYFCFCGKLRNPTPNRNDLAHSCGDMCLNTSQCTHPCQLKCHPGVIFCYFFSKIFCNNSIIF